MPTRPRVHQSVPPAPVRPRLKTAERGYGSVWRRCRLDFLRDNPLCVVCLAGDPAKGVSSVLEPATVVDHVIPHKGDEGLFWDRANWQGLCKRHHDIKTVREDGGLGHVMKEKEQ